MRSMRTTTGWAGALLLIVPFLAHAADPKHELRRNPFERPALAEVLATASSRSADTRSSGDPGLRAVLVAGSSSVVNFGGVIMQIGETSNGYRLLAVEEGRAIFSNKGKKVAISLYEQGGSKP